MKTNKKYTKTSTFLFPLLKIPKYTFNCHIENNFHKVLHTTRFINAYLHDNSLPYYSGDCVYLLLENYQDPKFEEFYFTLTSFPNYLDDYESNGYLVAMYSIPEENKKDYDLILEGKYSEISDAAKALIIGNYYYHGAKMTLSLILHKSDALKETWEKTLTFIGKDIKSPANLRDQEVWSKIIQENQILTKEVFAELKLSNKIKPSKEFDKL